MILIVLGNTAWNTGIKRRKGEMRYRVAFGKGAVEIPLLGVAVRRAMGWQCEHLVSCGFQMWGSRWTFPSGTVSIAGILQCSEQLTFQPTASNVPQFRGSPKRAL